MAGAVFFNIWQTESKEKQQALLAAMRQEAPYLQAKPGFLSLIAWAGEADDLRIIVRGEWTSQAAFEAAVSRDPQALASREKLAALGTPKPGSLLKRFVSKTANTVLWPRAYGLALAQPKRVGRPH